MASRVTWGCVVSLKGLEDAKSHCNRDPNCQALGGGARFPTRSDTNWPVQSQKKA